MEAVDIRNLVTSSMDDAGFDRGHGRRWVSSAEGVDWIFELDRGAAWSSWGVMVGAAVRDWRPSGTSPSANDGAVLVDYSLLGDGVPPGAATSRLGDHRAYFTAAFDHRHDHLSREERRQAFDFMAGDLSQLAVRYPTLERLRAGVAAGLFDSGFVDPRLR